MWIDPNFGDWIKLVGGNRISRLSLNLDSNHSSGTSELQTLKLYSLGGLGGPRKHYTHWWPEDQSYEIFLVI